MLFRSLSHWVGTKHCAAWLAILRNQNCAGLKIAFHRCCKLFLAQDNNTNTLLVLTQFEGLEYGSFQLCSRGCPIVRRSSACGYCYCCKSVCSAHKHSTRPDCILLSRPSHMVSAGVYTTSISIRLRNIQGQNSQPSPICGGPFLRTFSTAPLKTWLHFQCTYHS